MSVASGGSGRARVAVALGAVYLIWGSSYLATKVMVTHEPPLFAAGIRFSLAGLLLAAVAWWRSGPPKINRRELGHVAVVAAGAIVASNGCNVLGMQHVPSNVSALLNATPALWIAWLGTFGRRATPLTLAARLGLVTGLAGVALVLAPGDDALRLATLGWPLVILVGCIGWSLATAWFRHAEIANTPTMFLGLQMLAGGAALLGWAALAAEPFQMNWTPPGTAAFLWLTLMSSYIAYSAFAYLATHTSPVVIGTYAYVNPLIATMLGWLVLDEALEPLQVLGMVVILAGVALATGYLGAGWRLAMRRRA